MCFSRGSKIFRGPGPPMEVGPPHGPDLATPLITALAWNLEGPIHRSQTFSPSLNRAPNAPTKSLHSLLQSVVDQPSFGIVSGDAGAIVVLVDLHPLLEVDADLRLEAGWEVEAAHAQERERGLVVDQDLEGKGE